MMLRRRFQDEGDGGERRVLGQAFYEEGHVTRIARRLLGKVLATGRGRTLTSGVIVETEAYAGEGDGACHAHLGKFTRRTAVMFGPGGHAYVYLCYGIHHLFNIVTNGEGRADAVLVRAVEPLDGLSLMQRRRHLTGLRKNLTGGPGCLTPALKITTRDNRSPLFQPDGRLRIEDAGFRIPRRQVCSGPRIGVDYAGDDAAKPWRFWIGNNPWISVVPRT